jgi:hypothetical protein
MVVPICVVQATLQQLQDDLDSLTSQHSQTAAELSALQASSATLESETEGLGEKVQGLEQLLDKVGCDVYSFIHGWCVICVRTPYINIIIMRAWGRRCRA